MSEATDHTDDIDETGHTDSVALLRQRLRAALTTAMKARDQVRVRALRDGLGAIDNAESIEAPRDRSSEPSAAGSPHIAGASAGLGVTEATRRALTAAQVAEVVRRQIDERLAAADDIERGGAAERAAQLRDEAGVLLAFLER